MNENLTFGWTSCLTYETGQRELGYNYFSRLLDEMRDNGMERLLVMMANCHDPSVDPFNHGIAWPVKNPGLKNLVDPKAINASESSEFFSRIMEKAEKLGIEIYFEIKYMRMEGVEESYPGIGGRGKTNLVCCDNRQAHKYMRDKIRDLIERYPGVNGIVLEHPSYWGVCSCQSTKLKFLEDTGKDISQVDEIEVLNWQNKRVAWAVSDLITLAKSIQKKMKFGMFTGFSPVDPVYGDVAKYQHWRGQNIETLKDTGLDFVMPYCEGRHRENEAEHMERVIEYLNPLKIYLHTTIRKTLPGGYPLPPKGPEYIKNIIEWAVAYAGKCPRFTGMSFFNEVNIPQENRNAVYETIRKKYECLRERGIFSGKEKSSKSKPK